jgi:hypothetical protein
MRLLISFLSLVLLASATANAQTARVQIINNTPDDAFDLYVGDQLVKDNFAFRTATPYMDVAAGTVNIGIAPSTSTSSADAIKIPVTFEAGGTSVMMVTGLLNGSPPFDLKSFWTAKESSADAGKTSVLWYHGSPDAGTVDLLLGGTTFVDDASYGYYTTSYTEMNSAQVSQLVFADPTDNTQVFGSYDLDLSTYGGMSMTIMGTGYVNQEPSFEPWAVLSNGVTFPLPKTVSGQPGPTGGAALVQFVHNAPSATVDVYVNGELALDDFAYKTATPFIEMVSGTSTIAIADRNSTSASQAVATTTLTVDSNQRHIVFVNGTLDPAVLTAPSDLSLSKFSPAQEEAPTLDDVSVLFYNGMNNGAVVDLESGGTMWADNTAAGTFGIGYNDVTANSVYTLNLTDGTGASMGSYNLDLSWWKGRTATVFVGPGYANPSVPEVWVALSNGGTFPLTQISQSPNATARIQLIHNAPTATVDVYVDGQLMFDDFAWRTATPFIEIAAGVPLSVAIAPANSTSVADAVGTIPVTLEPGKTYIAIADGLINGTPALTINAIDVAREAATDPNNVDIIYYNGLMNGVATDLMLGDVISVDNSTFGTFGTYTSLTPGTTPFVFHLTDETGANVIGSYDADFSWWKGGSAVIFSGRGYADADADKTELWVALSNGGTYPLSLHGLSPLVVNAGLPVNYGPNPVISQFNVNVVLPANSDVQTTIVSASGNVVDNQNFGTLPQGQNVLQFDMASVPNGHYYLTIVSAAGQQTIPFSVFRE